MSLADQAAADLAAIFADEQGFAAEVELTSPDGITVGVRAFTADVAHLIDPQTGQAVSGRVVSLALPLALLADWPGLAIGVADTDRKPWSVKFCDVTGAEHTVRIRETRPDRTLGVLLCFVEAYKVTGA